MYRLESLRIQNFKAFREVLPLDLGGRHALIYGKNGSGKSSLYWALYTFFESSVKRNEDLEKYFRVFDPLDPRTHESLRNVFEDSTVDTRIQLEVRNEDTGIRTSYEISTNRINTNLEGDTRIAEANISSDFINYKLLHNFFNTTHKHEVNLWSVFERDVFPYFYDPEKRKTFKKLIDELPGMVPRKSNGDISRVSTNRRRAFDEYLDITNRKISAFIAEIETRANEFLTTAFGERRNFLRLHLEYPRKIQFDHAKNGAINSANQQIKLWVEMFDERTGVWIENHRPQTFLNEAQLTRIAIAIRVGALRTRVNTTDFKILVLDDMLISLDLSNRFQVVKMLLNPDNLPGLQFFGGFQKIILTHDKGFFNLVKRLAPANEWKFFELEKDEFNTDSPRIKPFLGNLERAKEHLKNGRLEECAFLLRKEVEEMAKSELDPEMRNEGHRELADMLNSLKRKLREKVPERMRRFRKPDLSAEVVEKLNTDFENDEGLSPSDIGKLKSLQRELYRYICEHYTTEEELDPIFKSVQVIVDQVLNPASHSTTTPISQSEVEDALEKVIQFRDFLERIKRI